MHIPVRQRRRLRRTVRLEMVQILQSDLMADRWLGLSVLPAQPRRSRIHLLDAVHRHVGCLRGEIRLALVRPLSLAGLAAIMYRAASMCEQLRRSHGLAGYGCIVPYN